MTTTDTTNINTQTTGEANKEAETMVKDKQAAGPYNIVFILTDQERRFRPGELPRGYRLPAHERLAKNGVVFENHRINSCVCTSSRSVIYTGLHIQQTKMFDNTNFPWMQSMSTDIKTLGHHLREAGYYTAYKGKWHLTSEFETDNTLEAPTKIFTQEMEAYGFSDYFGVGDIIAHPGWLPARWHDRRRCRELATRQGLGTGAAEKAVVPGGESGQPPRRDVLRHGRAGTACAGQKQSDPHRRRSGP